MKAPVMRFMVMQYSDKWRAYALGEDSVFLSGRSWMSAWNGKPCCHIFPHSTLYRLVLRFTRRLHITQRRYDLFYSQAWNAKVGTVSILADSLFRLPGLCGCLIRVILYDIRYVESWECVQLMSTVHCFCSTKISNSSDKKQTPNLWPL